MSFPRENPSALYPRQLLDPSFRIIRVLWFENNSSLHGRQAIHLGMLEIPLDQNELGYDALSYTWGKPTSDLSRQNPWMTGRITPREYASQVIYVNGKELTVTTNLLYALERLQPRYQGMRKVQYLWVDAICINQNDDQEKAEQVKMMGDIYKKAAEVLVWLGEEDGDTDSDMAIDLLWGIYCDFVAFVEDSEEADSIMTQINQAGDDLQIDRLVTSGVPFTNITGIASKIFQLQKLWIERVDFHGLGVRCDAQAWAAVARLLGREWFSRLWTYQEKALARSATLLVGGKSIAWTDCNTVMGIITNHDNTTGKTKVLPKGEARIFFESSQPSEANVLALGGSYQNLFEVVRSTSSRVCSDPRDKIYGVLGTMSKQDAGYMHILPLVDYAATSTYQKLYTEFARFYLEDCEDLRILQYCSCHPRSSSGLPSWAPDWSRPQFGNMLPSKAYTAGGQSDPIIGYRSEDKEMVVYGIEIDRIKILAPLAHPDLPDIKAMNEAQQLGLAKDYMMFFGCLYMACQDADYLGLLQGKWPFRWSDMVAALKWSEPYVTGQTYAEAYWRTLIGDMDPYAFAHVFGQRAPLGLSISNMADIWLEQRPFPADSDPQEPNHKVRRAQYFYPVSSRVQALTMGKHFYLSHKNLMGIGTHNALEGDIVVVLPGYQVPILLRKRAHEEHYIVVGETYGTYSDPVGPLDGGLLDVVVHGFMDGEAMKNGRLEEFRIR